MHIYVPLYYCCSLHKDFTSMKKANFYSPGYCYVCANNKYAYQMPHIYYICKLIQVQIQGNYVSIYKLTTSTTWSETLVYVHFKLFTYAPEKISLPYYTCMSHYMSTVGCILTPKLLHILVKTATK